MPDEHKKNSPPLAMQLNFSYICNKLNKHGHQGKLIERFKRQPNDFTFNEMERLLAFFGYKKSDKGKTSGSRIIFKNENKRPIMLHKPHPGNTIKEYAMRQVLDELMLAGYIK